MSACQRAECGKLSTLHCPKCLALGIDKAKAAFCSQECFKDAWATHKALHSAAIAARQAEQQAPSTATYAFSGPLRPGFVSAQMRVPAHITAPDYAESGVPRSEETVRGANYISTMTEKELKLYRPVAKLTSEILQMCGAMVQPGVTPDQIDRAVFAATVANHAYPSTLNYREFPKSLCISVNEVICHGIPDDRPFADGDIVNADCSVFRDGFHGDCNATFYCGKVDDASAKLVETTRAALANAIKAVRPGTMYRDLGREIAHVVDKAGFSIVKSYCGHGVGSLFHSNPNIPHYPRNKAVGAMKKGHVFTIEPMINAGTWYDQLWPDEWTSTTKDGQRSAQFEHTMVVTDKGVEILTTANLANDLVMNPPAWARDHSGNQRVPCPPHLAQFARAVGVNVYVEGEEAQPQQTATETTTTTASTATATATATAE
jgi:methionyl aminopeptidase